MPKHKPGSIVRTKNGRYAKVLPNGRWRFISNPNKSKSAPAPTRKKRGRPRKRTVTEMEAEEF